MKVIVSVYRLSDIIAVNSVSYTASVFTRQNYVHSEQFNMLCIFYHTVLFL